MEIICAEAIVSFLDHLDMASVKKVRPRKSYRHPELDAKVRRERLKREVRTLKLARNAGVSVPHIYDVSYPEMAITMEFIPGRMLKDVLTDEAVSAEEKKAALKEAGGQLSLLHKAEVSHGDLTGSNIIVTPENTAVFIDMSMGGRAENDEQMAIDIITLKRSIMDDGLFSSVIEGYAGYSDIADAVLALEKRARYIHQG